MKILGWVGDGDLFGSDRAEDHAPSGVLAMTLPRPIAVPRRRLVRPFSLVSVSSVSGWQALSRAP